MAHEELQREQHVEASSDRGFGLVFAGALALVAAWPLLHASTPRWWAFALAAAIAAIAAARPAMLARANRLWTQLGVLLGKLVAPVALCVLFYAVVAPLGFVMRLTGRDPLRRKLDARGDSYWIARRPPGPPPGSLTNQF
ncbi:MAG TPA: SxtJ family membrane protein [Burkholderiales bacterium]|jgi:predicted membrane metal-binding protein|nr:SxtJ family membrane protein [Burkholderiales bacterium]